MTYANSGTTQPIGALTQATLGSADYDTFGYDVNTGRLTQYKFNVGSPLKTDTGDVTWNANGTLKQLAITDQLNSSNTQTCTYGYDDLSRVTIANCGTPWNQSFSFDPFGNVTKAGSLNWACSTCYDTTKNRYNSTLSPLISYDNNGNLTNDTFHAYTWDAEGKSLSIDAVVVLTYDALGRMVEQNKSGSYTEIVYAPGGAKFGLMTGQTLQKAFVVLPGGGTAVYNSSGLAYYRHSDWLGSSRLATTPSRTCYWDTAYAPFGENYASPASGCTAQELSFTGQNQDTVPGMYDFLYREYHANQGRWLSPDPVGLAAVNPTNPQSWNRYAYVGNQPLTTIDSLGQLWACVFSGDWFGNFFGGCSWFTDARDQCGTEGCDDRREGPGQNGGDKNEGGGSGNKSAKNGAANKEKSHGCIGTRVATGIQGVVNTGLGELKTAGAIGVGLLGAGAAAETEGTSLFATLAAGYVAISSQGQVLTGQAQLYSAISGDFKTGEQIKQVGDIMSGPITGITTLAATKKPEVAAIVANIESAITLGAGAVNSETVADKIANGVDAALTFLGVQDGSCP